MIHKVFADNHNFKEVNFTNGLNIVLGSKSSDSDDKDTRNGVGKTLLIDIINFCLGSHIDKNSKLKKIDLIKDWTFSIIIDLYGTKCTVSRSIDEPGTVFVKGDFSNFPKQPQPTLDGHYYKLKDWTELLGNYNFNLNETLDYKPSFRSLISYFIRNTPEAYLDPFTTYRHQNNITLQSNTSFLLGLNWKCASKAQLIKDKEKNLKEEEKKIMETYPNLGAIETKKINVENELNKKQQELNTFKLHKRYKDIEKEVNQITKEIKLLVNENVTLNRKLDNYTESIKTEKNPKEDALNKLYSEMDSIFKPSAKKTLNEVKEFHKNLIKNRKEFLKVEISELKNTIKHHEELIQEYDTKRSELMQILNTHSALEDYSLIQMEISDYKTEINKLNDIINQFKRIEDNKDEIKEEKNILNQKIKREYELQRSKWEKSITIFNENTKALYGENGSLIINFSEKGYKFNIEFPKNESRGVSKMKIFCYDAMLLELNSIYNNIDFLIHDSEIFSDVDSRQVAKAMNLIKNKCDEHNLQYICTLNSDELEKINLEIANDFNIFEHVKLELKDNDSQNHLLGEIF